MVTMCQIILNNLINVGWSIQFPQEEKPRANKLTACQGERHSDLFRFMHHKETDILKICVCKCVYMCMCKCTSTGVHIYVRTISPPWVLFLRNHLPCALREYHTGTWGHYCDYTGWSVTSIFSILGLQVCTTIPGYLTCSKNWTQVNY